MVFCRSSTKMPPRRGWNCTPSAFSRIAGSRRRCALARQVRRDESARQGTPTPINSASASTRQGRCREQATQRRNRKTSNTQLRFARAGIQLRYRASRHRTSNYCPARLHFDVGRSMPARVLSELDVRCFRVFASAPWPKFFSTRKKGLNMFLNVKKIMPPVCGSITGQAAWRARLC